MMLATVSPCVMVLCGVVWSSGELPECLTDGVDVMTEMQQQEMKILQEVLQ